MRIQDVIDALQRILVAHGNVLVAIEDLEFGGAYPAGEVREHVERDGVYGVPAGEITALISGAR